MTLAIIIIIIIVIILLTSHSPYSLSFGVSTIAFGLKFFSALDVLSFHVRMTTPSWLNSWYLMELFTSKAPSPLRKPILPYSVPLLFSGTITYKSLSNLICKNLWSFTKKYITISSLLTRDVKLSQILLLLTTQQVVYTAKILPQFSLAQYESKVVGSRFKRATYSVTVLHEMNLNLKSLMFWTMSNKLAHSLLRLFIVLSLLFRWVRKREIMYLLGKYTETQATSGEFSSTI